MKMIFFCLFSLFLLNSCAHIKNGYHIQRNNYASYSDVSDRYSVSLERLRSANHNVDFSKLNWVFIPRRVGFLGFWQLQNEQKLIELEQSEQDSQLADNSSDKKSGRTEVSTNSRVTSVKGVKRSKKFKLNLLWPTPTIPMISSRYGMRKGRMHHGIDIPSPVGTKIIASEAGKVIYSNNKISGYGKMTIIAHENDYLTVYAHASKNLFKEGDYVKKGDIIALSGKTGRVTGPHLHYEVRRKDKSIDPLKFVKIPPRKKRNLASSRRSRRNKKRK